MKKNKAVIQFLVKFFAVYFVLTMLYSFYLEKNQQSETVFSCAPVTETVSNHAKMICEWLGYNVVTAQSKQELSILFDVNDKTVSKIVEGCTSVSVMILFLAFIVAFKGSLKNTIIFGLVGIGLIYITNIIRIVILTLAIYHYPKYSDFLHGIVFPAIIYGMVFLLWIIWVKKFATFKKKDE